MGLVNGYSHMSTQRDQLMCTQTVHLTLERQEQSLDIILNVCDLLQYKCTPHAHIHIFTERPTTMDAERPVHVAEAGIAIENHSEGLRSLVMLSVVG